LFSVAIVVFVFFVSKSGSLCIISVGFVFPQQRTDYAVELSMFT